MLIVIKRTCLFFLGLFWLYSSLSAGAWEASSNDRTPFSVTSVSLSEEAEIRDLWRGSWLGVGEWMEAVLLGKLSFLRILYSFEVVANAFKCKPIPGKICLEESLPGLIGTRCLSLVLIFSSDCVTKELQFEPSSKFFLWALTISKSRQRLRMPRCKLKTDYRQWF